MNAQAPLPDHEVERVLDRLEKHSEIIGQLLESERGRGILEKLVQNEAALLGYLAELDDEGAGATPGESRAWSPFRRRRPAAPPSKPQETAAAAQKQSWRQKAWGWLRGTGKFLGEKLFDKVNDLVKSYLGAGKD